jgi:hypothetical protein
VGGSRRGLVVVVALSMCLLAACAVHNGRIEGTIMIPGGEPVRGVTVLAISTPDHVTHAAVSSIAGEFHMYVPPGTYVVTMYLGRTDETLAKIAVEAGKTVVLTINGERLWRAR